MNTLKSLLWNHGLITLLVFFNVIPIATSICLDSELLDYKVGLTSAIIYQSLALFGIICGYRLSSVNRIVRREPMAINVGKSYFYCMTLLSFVGAYVSYKNVSMFISMNDLQKQMGDGQSIAELREMTGAGGLSGVFKMTATLPLFTFLSTSALLMFCKIDRKSKKILHRTLIVSVICLAVKVALVFDRLSILAVLIVVVYNYFFNKSISKVVKVGAVALLLCAVSYLTLLRMSDGSIKDFLVLYFNLSVVNLQIDIDTQTNFNYNFSETFLQPLSYIFKYFGLRFHSYGPKNYCWNPAQSFWGDFFIDFNWVGLFFMPFLGYCIRKIEYARYSNVYFQIIYFLLAYTFFSFSTVPIIRSIEFWLMLIVGRFMAKKLVTVR